ncbi:MAG: rod shape-determining protein RodA [Deltaproteobacteria bacterium]|nr:rod shape-determining protein RodA [Deltaproteobacteria bacterium]
MIDRRLINNFDWLLLMVVLIIASIGVLNLYSATFSTYGGIGQRIYVKQIYWVIMGLCCMIASLSFDYHKFQSYAYPAYFINLFFLVVVLVIGRAISGSQRWINLGFFSYQPSESMKVILIMVLAKYSCLNEVKDGYSLRDLVTPALLVLMPAVLILKEPDLGSAFILVLLSSIMFLFVRIKWKTLTLITISGIAAAPLAWHFMKDYQRNRILTFISPDNDPLGAGYHIIQSKIAVGSGQFWGKGFLKGTQSQLKFLPEQHTDFAFSVLAEEWGLMGSLVLILLFLILVLWGLNIAQRSRDQYGNMLAFGVVSYLFLEIVINVGMVTGVLPVVGIPLPLISYGGSSVISTMISLGILMNISMRRFIFHSAGSGQETS